MIYTVTFNPALDYVIRVDELALGEVNRAVKEEIYFGGKGLNVSAVLGQLGYTSTALGFIAGFTGDEIEREARDRGLETDFIRLKKGLSRINIKLKAKEETDINGLGPEISSEETEALFEKLERLESGDILVLSGSIPASMDDRIYEIIMERLSGRGIEIVVDATKDLLMNVLKYHPFLIKPNNHELGEMFDRELKTDDEIVSHARKLQEMGAGNVLVSMAGDGAVLVSRDGNVTKIGVPKGKVKNSVGAGDSMVAGFIAGYLEKNDYAYALKLGTAAGSATAFSDGLAERVQIEALLKEMMVTEKTLNRYH